MHKLTFVYFNFDINSTQKCLIINKFTAMVKPMYNFMTDNVCFRQNHLLLDIDTSPIHNFQLYTVLLCRFFVF